MVTHTSLALRIILRADSSKIHLIASQQVLTVYVSGVHKWVTNWEKIERGNTLEKIREAKTRGKFSLYTHARTKTYYI